MSDSITKVTDLVIPEVLAPAIEAKVAAKAKVLPYAKVDTTLEGVPGMTIKVPVWTYVGAAVEVDEGEECPTTAMAMDSDEHKIKKAMKSIPITDEAALGQGSAVGQAETQLAKSIIDKIDSDIIAAGYAKAGVTVNAEGKISYAGIVNAATKFLDEEDDVAKVLFIHPAQESALLTDPQFISADKFTAGVAVRGAIGMVAGCWVKKSRKIEFVEKAGEVPAHYRDLIVKVEADSAETEYTEDELPAFTLYLKRGVLVETERHPRKQLTEVTASQYYCAACTNSGKVIVANFAG